MSILNRQKHDLAEARAIIAKLARIEPKNAGDRRYIESWRLYLNRTGDAANIGRFRLHNLRVVASTYGLCDAPVERPEPRDLMV
jgi:hypothetical protein